MMAAAEVATPGGGRRARGDARDETRGIPHEGHGGTPGSVPLFSTIIPAAGITAYVGVRSRRRAKWWRTPPLAPPNVMAMTM